MTKSIESLVAELIDGKAKPEGIAAMSDVELVAYVENTIESLHAELYTGDDGYAHAHDENYFSWLEKEIFAVKREMDKRGMDAKSIIGLPWA